MGDDFYGILLTFGSFFLGLMAFYCIVLVIGDIAYLLENERMDDDWCESEGYEMVLSSKLTQEVQQVTCGNVSSDGEIIAEKTFKRLRDKK